MTNAAVRTAHLKDTTDLYEDIQKRDAAGRFVRQAQRMVDGHPASSKLDLFEGFVKKIVDEVQANPNSVAGHCDLRDLRRRRRLLRLRLRTAAGFLRRRHADSDDRGFSVHQGRPHFARLHRPRLHFEVHREKLGTWSRSPSAAATTCRTRNTTTGTAYTCP